MDGFTWLVTALANFAPCHWRMDAFRNYMGHPDYIDTALTPRQRYSWQKKGK